MTAVDALLAPVRARTEAEAGCSSTPCGSKVCNAQRDRQALLAAVDAVTALHSSDTYGECRRCTHGPGRYFKYPCPTVAALVAALGGAPNDQEES